MPLDAGRASDDPPVEVRRSARRKKTVSAHWSGDRVVLQVPARMPAREVGRWEREMVAKLVASRRRNQARSHHRAGDDYLSRRARELSDRHLGGRARPASISWSSRQNTRWGSATPATGTIRISRRLHSVPEWVLDAVIFHELCHLIEAGHGPAFRALESRLPDMERAQAFLDGAAWALSSPPDADVDAGPEGT